MNRKHIYVLLIAFVAASCSVSYQPASIQYQQYRIEKNNRVDTGLVNMLQPYTASLQNTMEKVIGTSAAMLSNAYAVESPLGNFMADCFKMMAEKKFGFTVDVAFMNRGGVRSYIPQGKITVGKIYELMPFDNVLVVQELKGDVLRALFNQIAVDGGWPVSVGTSFVIQNKKATQISINGQPLRDDIVYKVVNSDYVANGGSDCAMLKGIPQQNKGYLMRDALIEYVSNLTAAGKQLDPKIENRVVNHE